MEQKSDKKFEASAVGTLKQMIKEEIFHLHGGSGLQQPTPAKSLNEIKEEFADIKN